MMLVVITGREKLAQLMHVNASGYKMLIHPTAFIVHRCALRSTLKPTHSTFTFHFHLQNRLHLLPKYSRLPNAYRPHEFSPSMKMFGDALFNPHVQAIVNEKDAERAKAMLKLIVASGNPRNWGKVRAAVSA